MTTKENPNKEFDCHASAMPGEEMFVLLARDPRAPDLVELWATFRTADITAKRRPESDARQVNEAMLCAEKMRDWRSKNYGLWRIKPDRGEPWPPMQTRCPHGHVNWNHCPVCNRARIETEKSQMAPLLIDGNQVAIFEKRLKDLKVTRAYTLASNESKMLFDLMQMLVETMLYGEVRTSPAPTYHK